MYALQIDANDGRRARNVPLGWKGNSKRVSAKKREKVGGAPFCGCGKGLSTGLSL